MSPNPLDDPIRSIILDGSTLDSLADLTDPIHIPSSPSKPSLFATLLDLDAVHDSFKAKELEFGLDAIGARFVNGVRESLYELPASDSIKDAMKDGWTIQLHQPQRFEDNLWRMMAAMEANMGTLVGANAYLTPKSTQGLAPHWDDVAIAVLQLYGEKEWSVWKCTRSMNYPSGDLDPQSLGKPFLTVTLKPGDVLLLPRGYIHQAVSSDEADCGHLTLSWGQGDGDTLGVISKTVEAAMALPPFHVQLPDVLKRSVRMDGADEVDVVALFRALADHLENHGEVARNGRNALAHDFMSSRLPPHPAQLPSPDDHAGGAEPTFADEDVIELVGDYFCVLKETPATDLCLKSSGGVVDVAFEGGSELRIMSCIGNDRQSHMMDARGGCDDEGCEDEGCRGGHEHAHGHVHGECSSMDEDDDEDDEDDDEDDEDDEDDDGPGGALISLPIKFTAAVEGILEKRRMTVAELDCEDKPAVARMLVEIGMCRVVNGNRKKARK